jgi:pseudaminic acid synthase
MSEPTSFSISTPQGPRFIGPGHPAWIIAELSANHLGDFDRARRMIDAVAEAGADAVKLQTYTADTLTIDCDLPYYQVKLNDAWRGQTLYQLYQKAYTPWDWQPRLKEHADALGLTLFSSPFDPSAVDFLEQMNVAVYKVASLEINYVQLLEAIGRCKKPVIFSRGLSSPEEIQAAIETLKAAGAPAVAVLHCVSAYPADAAHMHLRTIQDLSKRFNCVSGLSDHCLSRVVPIAAIAQGACILEKHFTLDRSDGGPDAAFSLEPAELKQLVDDVRECEAALGSADYVSEAPEEAHRIFRRSIVAIRDIDVGETITEEHVRVIRPGFGMDPRDLERLLGKKASSSIPRGEPMDWNYVR